MEDKELEAIKIAANMLVEHGLGDWHLRLKSVTSFHAQTRYDPKLITMNKRFIQIATKEKFVGVIYHEIAHALVGGKARHGRLFKAKVYELSGSMEFAGYATDAHIGKFLTHCPNCLKEGSTNQNEDKRYCRPCRVNTGRRIELTLTKNPLRLVEWK